MTGHQRKFLVRQQNNGRVGYAICHDHPPVIGREDRARIQVLRELVGEELGMTLAELTEREEGR